MAGGLLRTKSIDQSIADTQDEENGLRRTLGPIDLVVFGVGVIIGTGIFVLTGEAAGTRAGPAVALSFVAAGIAVPLLLVLTAAVIVLVSVPPAGRYFVPRAAPAGPLPPGYMICPDPSLHLAERKSIG